MFSYVSLEQGVPQDHPLRAVRKLTDTVLRTLSPELGALYADSGRPSIAPEYILRALLLQVFYSVRSERLVLAQIATDAKSNEITAVPNLLRMLALKGTIKRAAQHLAIDGHHTLELFRKLRHKPLKRIAKLIGVEIAKQPAEGVVAGQAVGQGEKAAQKRLFGLSKQSHIHRTLTAAQHAAQGDHQQFVKVMQRGIAAARILNSFPTGAKLLQCFFAGHEIPLQETSCLTTLHVSGNRGPWPLWFSTISDSIALRVGSAGRRNESGRRMGVEGGVSERVLRNGENPGFLVPEAAQPGTPGALGWNRMQKDRERRQMGVYCLPAERQNGNSGSEGEMR
jgi:predicted transposase YbfD/YdcC